MSLRGKFRPKLKNNFKKEPMIQKQYITSQLFLNLC